MFHDKADLTYEEDYEESLLKTRRPLFNQGYILATVNQVQGKHTVMKCKI